MAGGNKNIKPEDGKQFSKEYQPEEKWTEQKALQLGNDLIDWLKAKDEDGEDKGNMFYNEFLIVEKDLHPNKISQLSDKFSSFRELIEKAKKIQEIKLVKYGVGDRLNATMTKFTLTNNHGWTDRVDQTTQGKSTNSTPPTIIFLEDPQSDD
jgi:hypothetical protein